MVRQKAKANWQPTIWDKIDVEECESGKGKRVEEEEDQLSRLVSKGFSYFWWVAIE